MERSSRRANIRKIGEQTRTKGNKRKIRAIWHTGESVKQSNVKMSVS